MCICERTSATLSRAHLHAPTSLIVFHFFQLNLGIIPQTFFALVKKINKNKLKLGDSNLTSKKDAKFALCNV